MTGAADLAAAAARVEAADPDRFAATMASPADLRAALWPVYAVNLEIARAAWVSQEGMIGEMRLQWWADALAALAQDGVPPAHEIGRALPRAAAQPLADVVEARRLDCWREPFADGAALSAYLAATSGALHVAAGAALGADAREQALLRDFGAAAGMAGWLRALPELEARGWRALPGMDVAAADLAGLAEGARQALIRARRALRPASRAARVAMLPSWQADAILRRAATTPGLIASGGLGGSEFSRRFSLLRAALAL